jgi:hypothetical protein
VAGQLDDAIIVALVLRHFVERAANRCCENSGRARNGLLL